MTKQELVKALAEQFQEQREEFIADVRKSIATYIEAQGSGCLALIELGGPKPVRWELSADPDYVGRLISFCRGKDHNGRKLDSALTEPVVELVTKKFEKLYSDNSDKISAGVLALIVNDANMSKAMVEAIVGSAGLATAAVRNKVALLLLDHLRVYIHSTAGKALLASLGKSIAASVSKPVGMKVAMLVAKLMATHLKVVLAKVLSTGALKMVIAAAVKKFLVVAVISAIAKGVAAKFGIGLGAAFMWVLLPLVAAYITYQIYTFPKELGEKVGEQVAKELSGQYRAVNEEVFDRVVAHILETGVHALVAPIAASAEVQDAIRDMMREA